MHRVHDFLWTLFFAVLSFVWILSLIALMIWTADRGGLLEGEAKPVKSDREGKCINSACDQPCKKAGKFLRHLGVCE
jgi:hypothetical protein